MHIFMADFPQCTVQYLCSLLLSCPLLSTAVTSFSLPSHQFLSALILSLALCHHLVVCSRCHLVTYSLLPSCCLLSAVISLCALHLCHPPSCHLLCSKSLLLTQVAHASRPSHALSVGHWGCPCKVHPTNPCNLLMPPGLTF